MTVFEASFLGVKFIAGQIRRIASAGGYLFVADGEVSSGERIRN
jgi:hypothetical protein